MILDTCASECHYLTILLTHFSYNPLTYYSALQPAVKQCKEASCKLVFDLPVAKITGQLTKKNWQNNGEQVTNIECLYCYAEHLICIQIPAISSTATHGSEKHIPVRNLTFQSLNLKSTPSGRRSIMLKETSEKRSDTNKQKFKNSELA